MGRKHKKKRGTEHGGDRSQHRQVLQDHVCQGKRFRPPLLHYMLSAGQGPPHVEWVRWALPEMVWIKLLICAHGLRRAGELVHAAVEAGQTVAKADMRVYCMASDYVFTDGEQREFSAAIGREPLIEMSQAFATFVKFYPDFPMAWIVKPAHLDAATAGNDELDQIRVLVRDGRPRRERAAMEIQVCAMFAILASGGLQMRNLPNLNLIDVYPETDLSREMGSQVRAALNVFLVQATGSAWSKSFWERGRQITPCLDLRWEVPVPDMSAMMDANAAGTRFARAVPIEVAKLFEMFPPDAADPRRVEVLLGLLQRQGQLAADVARMLTLTMSPWAEMAHRAMAETLIRLRWFAANDQGDNYEWFVNYGLGQEKLHIEHLKTLLADSEQTDLDEIKKQIEAREVWLNDQRFHWLQEVDVGGGTHDKDLRKLAEEAGCPDLRNLVFQPLSSVVHGHWNAIARQNLKPCASPLHGTHRVPYEYDRPIRLDALATVLELYADSYALVANLAGITESAESAAVEAWFKEAKKAKGWAIYGAASDDADAEQSGDDQAEPSSDGAGTSD